MDRAERVIKAVSSEILPYLGEHERRLLAGSLAKGYGFGGQKIVCAYTGFAACTVSRAVAELNNGDYSKALEEGCERNAGAGRKSAIETNPDLLDFIEGLLQANTYGDPMSVITYTSLSLRDIAKEVLDKKGIKISQNIVSTALDLLGYSKQKNQKMEQLGEPHPDRDAQFKHINETGTRYVSENAPFISVDCKKKENIGNFKKCGISTEKRCTKGVGS